MPVVWTRYPWLCGYLISPAAFHFVTTSTISSSKCYFWAAPLLLMTGGSTAATTTTTTTTVVSTNTLRICWYFHFLRRAAEVVFLNVYHGKGIPNERDSIGEFIYYLIWGLINGCTATCVSQSLEEESNDDNNNNNNSLSINNIVATTGLILFWLGQIGNFYCHAHLRSLRPNKDDNRWIIPQQFPFSILIAPHYTFEIISWFGYLLVSGFAPPAIFILILSIATLLDMSTKRKRKYIKMYKEGGGGGGGGGSNSSSPETRWVLIPFLY